MGSNGSAANPVNLQTNGAVTQLGSAFNIEASGWSVTTSYDNQFGTGSHVPVLDNIGGMFMADPTLHQGTTQTIGGLTNVANLGAGSIAITNLTTGGLYNTDATLIIKPASGKSYTFGGSIRNNGSFADPNDVAAGTGKLNLTIDGPGTQIFRNTTILYTGATTLMAGTLQLGDNGVLPAKSPMFLDGGTLATGTYSETMTLALTLQDNSAIDLGLGTSASKLFFADSHSATWTAGKMLTVKDWDGLLAGGGTEELKFGSSATALTVSQLGEIQFLNPLGLAAGTYGANPQHGRGRAGDAGARAGNVGPAGHRPDRSLGLRLAEAEVT